MINTGRKTSSIWLLIILSIILAIIVASMWMFLSDKGRQQDKTYSGAKLVEYREDCILDWRIL